MSDTSMHPYRKYHAAPGQADHQLPGMRQRHRHPGHFGAIDELGLDMDDFMFVAGIGCSGWIPSPLFAADTLHTTHGRPIAYASGLKMARPDKNVFVASGDGDLSAIGGNHLIHAARRNINLTVVLVNNGIYGMTGGQTAPTTPHGLTTITSPYGNLEHAFRYFQTGRRGRGFLCGPLDHLSPQTDQKIDQKRHREKGIRPDRGGQPVSGAIRTGQQAG